ncbi:MAG TPA: glycosyltransferase family 2 protein [Thermomicrobiales bacterium]|nr:glycosyltransferase family 2 protein [Thermomicrobiales bacterium]
MMRYDVTAIVLTLNEEEHLPGCLTSLERLTGSVIVLDSGSSDRTVDIARASGARIETRRFDGYASQRNAALALAGTPWVLFLDADERLTPDGGIEIAAFLDNVRGDVAGARIPRHNVVFGRALRGGGWWPDHQTRLLRRDSASYDELRQVHEVVVLDGRSIDLVSPLVHINYETRGEFLRKQKRYTMQASDEALADGRIPRRRSYLAAPARELLRRFVALRGYRDGWTGLFLAAVLAFEQARLVWLVRRGADQ